MRLSELRKEAGLSLKAVSQYTGIASSTLSAIEGGYRKMTNLQIMSLSYLFDVSPEYLTGDKDAWIRVYDEDNEFYYRLSKSEYTELAAKGAVKLSVIKTQVTLVLGDYKSPNHTVDRTVSEEYSQYLYLKYEIDFESTISSLSPREKQEVMDYIRDHIKK